MGIDYEKAHKRIVFAFLKGILKTYGLRRKEKRQIRTTKPGPMYWDKTAEWVDPNGIPRKGCFKRKPGTEMVQEIEVPQGVVPEEILQYAEAVSEAFLETLRISEENTATWVRTHAENEKSGAA